MCILKYIIICTYLIISSHRSQCLRSVVPVTYLRGKSDGGNDVLIVCPSVNWHDENVYGKLATIIKWATTDQDNNGPVAQ